jgi:hypothetical protein
MGAFQASNTIVGSHPTDRELREHCEQWNRDPDAVSDEDFLRVEGHMLFCQACEERALEFERTLQSQIHQPLKTMTAGRTIYFDL